MRFHRTVPIRSLLVVAALLFSLSSPARADQWAPFRSFDVQSPRGGLLLSVTSDANERVSLTLRGWNRTGRAVGYTRQVANEEPPVDAFVSDDGYVATLDERLRAGREHVLVVYDPRGNVIRDSSLEEVLSPSETPVVPRSVSSRRWRYSGEPVRLLDRYLIIPTFTGRELFVDLPTGALLRGIRQFPNFEFFVRRGAQYLVRADYELRHDQEHSECNWVAGEAKCEPIDEKWPRAAPTWRRVGRATFSPVLALLPELRHAISSPAYCISGCANGAELRLFFEYQDDTYAYAIVIPEEASRRAREAGVLRAFARLFASGER